MGPPGLSGVEVVSATSSLDSTTTRAVSVTCPVGKVIVGGGAIAAEGFSVVQGPVAVVQSAPDKLGTATTWEAAAREMSAYGNTWALVAIAICANVAS